MVRESFRCLLANSKQAVMCLLLRSVFRLATTITAWLVECCRDGCPSGRFSHLHRWTLELCQSDHRVLGHLHDQGPSPSIAQFGRAANLERVGGSKLFQFNNNGSHCVLGDLQCYRFFLVPFPQICTSTQSGLGALWTVPSTSWIGFFSDMQCQLWDLI